MKLNMLARQIRRLPINEAIKQMEFSQKRASDRILKNLVLARKNMSIQKRYNLDPENVVIGKLRVLFSPLITSGILKIFDPLPSAGLSRSGFCREGQILETDQDTRPWPYGHHAPSHGAHQVRLQGVVAQNQTRADH